MRRPRSFALALLLALPVATLLLLWCGRCQAQEAKLRTTLTGHKGQTGVNAIAFSPDGTLLASGGGLDSDGVVKLWDVKTGTEKATIKVPCNPLFGQSVTSVAFSPDGTLLAAGCLDMAIKLWDVKTGKVKVTLCEGLTPRDVLENAGTGVSVAFSPDGALLAAGSGGKMVIWNMKTEQEKASRLAGGRGISSGRGISVAFSPDGTLLASGSGDGVINLWDGKTGKEKATLREAAGGQDKLGGGPHIRSVAFNHDGTLLASAVGDAIILWDVRKEQEKDTLRGHSTLVLSVAFNRDGTLLASGGADDKIRLWNVKMGEGNNLRGHTGWVRCAVFSPDGMLLASGDANGTIKLWDILPPE